MVLAFNANSQMPAMSHFFFLMVHVLFLAGRHLRSQALPCDQL